MHPLSKVGLKLDWAKIRLNMLDAQVRGFLDGDPYRIDPKPPLPSRKPLDEVLIDRADGAPNAIGVFRIVRRPPPSFSLIIGDYVHNLRCTLDHLVWQLSLLTTDTPHPYTQFPIFHKREAEPSIKGWTMDIPVEARNIITEMQPYNRPGFSVGHHRHYPLWQIGHLDNRDKHAEILVTILSESLVTVASDGTRTVSMFSSPLNDGDPVFADARLSKFTRPASDDEPHIYIEPTYGVVVEESPSVVIAFSQLVELHDFVDRKVIPRFARFFK